MKSFGLINNVNEYNMFCSRYKQYAESKFSNVSRETKDKIIISVYCCHSNSKKNRFIKEQYRLLKMLLISLGFKTSLSEVSIPSGIFLLFKYNFG